jgi:hypothetical protein
VRFSIPESSLSTLRERRVEQQRERASLNPLTLLRRFFSRSSRMRRAAGVSMRGAAQLQREVEDAHDAFLLDSDIGPMFYLTADGRVLVDGRSWDGEALREAAEGEAIGALTLAARKTGIDALLELIPSAPKGASECPVCGGTRWAQPAPGFPQKMVCVLCLGRGWVTPSMIRDAKAKGVSLERR